jgi:hypothetical protein
MNPSQDQFPSKSLDKENKMNMDTKKTCCTSSLSCVICMDVFAEPVLCGLCCPENHFTCENDLNSVRSPRNLSFWLSPYFYDEL